MLNRFVVIASLLLALVVIQSTPAFARVDTKQYPEEVLVPEPYLEKASYKLVRGVTNVITSPGEIPKQIVVTSRERGGLGALLGIFKGVGMTAMRVGSGVWEAITFFAPNDLDGNFGPILKPEYVWDPSVPTDTRLKKSM